MTTDLPQAYADAALKRVAPSLALSTYRRELKMDAPVFSGHDIEEAFRAGMQAVINAEDNGRDQADDNR